MSQNYQLQNLALAAVLLGFGTLAIDPAIAAQIPINPPPSIPLSALIDDPNDPNDDPDAFIVSPSGQFRFDSFEYNPVPPEDFVPTADDVFVTLMESEGRVELLFQIVTGNFVPGPGFYDLLLSYRAVAIGDNARFVGHELLMNGTEQIGIGDGFAFVNELILDEDNNLVARLDTQLGLPDFPDVVVDSAAFAPYRVLRMDKDIAVNGGSQTSGSFLSHVRETFFVTVIPEPNSMALLILGGLGLGVITAGNRGSRVR